MEDNKVTYIWLYHNDSSVKTIKEFMDRQKIFGIEPDAFFEENRELIFSQMTDKDLSEYKSQNKLSKLPTAAELSSGMNLPYPCKLRVDSKKAQYTIALSNTNLEVPEDDYYAFADERIQDIFQDEGYKTASLTKRQETCTVFGWFKSLYYFGEKNGSVTRNTNKYLSEFSDLSRYVLSLSTMVGDNGGSFSIKLPILPLDYQPFSVFVQSESGDSPNSPFFKVRKDSTSVHQNETDTYVKTNFSIQMDSGNYFSKLISSNDLIFINFEKLPFKREQSETGLDDIDNFNWTSKIAGNVYDMIGLVDDVTVVVDANSANGYVEITGRDLMKLLIEDGSFFFNSSTSSDPSTVFSNPGDTVKTGDIKSADSINGTFVDPLTRVRGVLGEIDIFKNWLNMDIAYILKGVFTQLSNIEVVPSHIFEQWGNSRTRLNEIISKK